MTLGRCTYTAGAWLQLGRSIAGAERCRSGIQAPFIANASIGPLRQRSRTQRQASVKVSAIIASIEPLPFRNGKRPQSHGSLGDGMLQLSKNSNETGRRSKSVKDVTAQSHRNLNQVLAKVL